MAADWAEESRSIRRPDRRKNAGDDAETEIGITEIDPSEMNPAFGDFVALAVLEVEPVDLSFSSAAEITYRMSTPSAKRKARLDPDDPAESDLLIGSNMTPEGPKVPIQRIQYDLDEDTEQDLKVTFESMQGGEIVVGKLFAQSDLGRFTAIFGPDDIAGTYREGAAIPMYTSMDVPNELILKLDPDA